MKYNIGDLVLLKHCEYKTRLHLHLLPHLRLLPRLLPRLRLRRPCPELFNSFGIITEVINHSDAWEGESTSDDNFYIWFSQIDGKEYSFYENEVTDEIVNSNL